MGTQQRLFGRLADGTDIQRITLTNPAGLQADIITYGGAIARLIVPDRAGRLQDVVLGYDTLEGYVHGQGFLGALIGRYANRIAGGRYERAGRVYELTKNENDSTTLHGGVGFDRRVWTVDSLEEGDFPALTLFYFSPDGEAGFPGNLRVKVTYRLCEDHALSITYRAAADRETPINLTNHTYFNLTGDFSQTVLHHRLRLDAPFFTPTGPDGIPSGEILSVAGTPMDFTRERELARPLDSAPEATRGYDHNYVLGGDGLRPVAWVYEPSSGRTLEVSTDQPGIQLYTANNLDGGELGKGGIPLTPYSGVCLETQCFPDSVNRPHFPSPFYGAGKEYFSTTVFRFGAI